MMDRTPERHGEALFFMCFFLSLFVGVQRSRAFSHRTAEDCSSSSPERILAVRCLRAPLGCCAVCNAQCAKTPRDLVLDWWPCGCQGVEGAGRWSPRIGVLTGSRPLGLRLSLRTCFFYFVQASYTRNLRLAPQQTAVESATNRCEIGPSELSSCRYNGQISPAHQTLGDTPRGSSSEPAHLFETLHCQLLARYTPEDKPTRPGHATVGRCSARRATRS